MLNMDIKVRPKQSKMYCVLKCKFSAEEYEKISFHAFPRDENLKLLWIEAIDTENWLPKSSSKLCSQHFEQKYFDPRPGMKPKLRANALPTLNLKLSRKMRRINRKHQSNLLINKTHHDRPNKTGVHISLDEIDIEKMKSNSKIEPIFIMEDKIQTVAESGASLDIPGCSNYKESINFAVMESTHEKSPKISSTRKLLTSSNASTFSSGKITLNKRDHNISSLDNQCAQISTISGITKIDPRHKYLKKIARQRAKINALKNFRRTMYRETKTLRQKTRRQENKIKNLKSLIKDLQSSKLPSEKSAKI